MPGVTQLVEAAVERGATFESMGTGKASQQDLSYYVLEIAREAEERIPSEPYKDGVIGGALFAIWTP
jgi:hypothetical protein